MVYHKREKRQQDSSQTFDKSKGQDKMGFAQIKNNFKNLSINQHSDNEKLKTKNN